jgi:hypothetical protein
MNAAITLISRETLAMWKTRAMFSRYNVMNIDTLRAAMVKAGEYVWRAQHAV